MAWGRFPCTTAFQSHTSESAASLGVISQMSYLLTISFMATSLAAAPSDAAIVVDYPQPYVLYQRDAADTGEVRIRGTLSGITEPCRVEARFNGGPWQTLDAATEEGRFTGTIAGHTGQGKLEVRSASHPDSVTVVEPVAVGDLFLVTGQSNADGRGSVNVTLADANPFVGVKYQGETWSRGGDPSDDSGKYASPWPIVLNTLIPEQKIPMGFVQTAVGSTVVRQWRKEGQLYERAMSLLHKATDGGMAVKAVLYYQGENDITHHNHLSVLGDYEQYKTHLTAMVADFHTDLKAPVLVGQITNLAPDRNRNDGIRRAQQEIWSESPHARPGAVTYDILPTDGVHYRDPVNMRAFAERWTYAIRNALYAQSPKRPPQLIAVKRTSDTDLQLTYDRVLSVSDWQGKPSARPAGFRVVTGDVSLGDTDINSASVQGKTVLLRFHLPVPDAARFFYGSGDDAQNKPVLRDPKTGQPVPLRFDVPIQ
jgi:Carbohydrate esterase, sialic acid-specific acetylesterase